MKPNVPTTKILDTVCSYFDIEEKLIKSSLRNKNIAKARHVYFYLCGEFTELTNEKISETVNREHSRYLHGRNKIKIEMTIYPILKKEIEEIISKLFECNKLIPESIDLLKMTENYTNSFI